MLVLFAGSLGAGVTATAVQARAGDEGGLVQCRSENPEGCASCRDYCEGQCMGARYVCRGGDSVEQPAGRGRERQAGNVGRRR